MFLLTRKTFQAALRDIPYTNIYTIAHSLQVNKQCQRHQRFKPSLNFLTQITISKKDNLKSHTLAILGIKNIFLTVQKDIVKLICVM